MANPTMQQSNVYLYGDMTTYLSPSGKVLDNLKTQHPDDYENAANQSSAGRYGYKKRGSSNTQYAGRQAQMHAYMCDNIDKYIQFGDRNAAKKAAQCDCKDGDDPTSLNCILQRDLKAQKIEGDFIREAFVDLGEEEFNPKRDFSATVDSSALPKVTENNIDTMIGRGVTGFIYPGDEGNYTGNTYGKPEGDGEKAESDWTENVKRIWSGQKGYDEQYDGGDKLTGEIGDPLVSFLPQGNSPRFTNQSADLYKL